MEGEASDCQVCSFCDKPFGSRKQRIRHERQVHLTAKKHNFIKYKCPLCDKKDRMSSLLAHFSEHGVDVFQSSTTTFKDKTAFADWKTDIEKDTYSKYVFQQRKVRRDGTVSTLFSCHRAGFFVSKGTGKRRVKIPGSNKIQGFCPARLHLTEQTTGECSVEAFPVHVGHELEISKLTLSKREREEIARLLAQRIPLDDILDQLRSTAQDHVLHRIHLIERKDLHNIIASYNLHHVAVFTKHYHHPPTSPTNQT